jgi:DNA-directed RNA polymerase subunit RPC12/RpoP
MFSMQVETLGDAFTHSWRITVRCAYGTHDGMRSIRACIYQAELDLPTLVWTRGRNFPLARLESRLMCPRCGSRRVVLMFQPPPVEQRARAVR